MDANGVRPAGLVALAVLVALAGCSGLSVGTERDPAPTTAVTPVPVADGGTTARSTLAPDARPPGVSEGGAVDADRLADAHVAFLDGRSYRWTVRYNETVTSGVAHSYRRTVLVAGPGRYLDRKQTAPTLPDQTTFVDDSGRYVRFSLRNSSSTSAQQWAGGARRHATAPVLADAASFVERYLAVESAERTVVRRDGATLVRLFAREAPEAVAARHDGTVTSYAATAYVTPGGFVRTLHVEYGLDPAGDDPQRVSLRFDYRLGNVTAPEPAWVADARGTATPAFGEDGTATPTGTPAGSPDGNGTGA